MRKDWKIIFIITDNTNNKEEGGCSRQGDGEKKTNEVPIVRCHPEGRTNIFSPIQYESGLGKGCKHNIFSHNVSTQEEEKFYFRNVV